MISIEDFNKIDMRVGRITKVLDHPNADKLYVLEIDIGDEKRVIVSGIKDWYSKEELLGKYVVVLTNLEPKKIRGIKSQGMILAAEKDGKIALLTVDREIDPGTRVR